MDERSDPFAPPFHGTGLPRRARLWLVGGTAALVGLGFLVFWLWAAGREGRAVRDLPAAERAALYQRTLEDLETLCADGKGELEHCAGQARFVLLFPECDADCERLARRQLTAPTR